MKEIRSQPQRRRLRSQWGGLRDFVGLFIAIFWLAMMTYLVWDELFVPPALPVADTPPRAKPGLRQDWFNVYYHSERIGTATTRIAPAEDGAGTVIRNRTSMLLYQFGGNRHVSAAGSALCDSNLNLRSFEFSAGTENLQVALSGTVRGKVLYLKSRELGELVNQEIPLGSELRLSNLIAPVPLDQLPREKGKAYSIDFFNPFTRSREAAELVFAGHESFTWNGHPVKAARVEVRYGDTKSTSWIADRTGQLLRLDTGLGLELKAIPQEAALEADAKDEQGCDILSLAMVPSDLTLEQPRALSRLRLKLRGLPEGYALENERQNWLSREEGILEITVRPPRKILAEPPEPTDMPYRWSGVYVHAHLKEVQSLATRATARATNLWDMASRLSKFVQRLLKKAPPVGPLTASQALDKGLGEANEYAIVFTSLARSVGLPTKICTGLIYQEGAFVYHCWPKIYVGEWVSMDPYLGQDLADATHIELVCGDFEDREKLQDFIAGMRILPAVREEQRT